MIRASNEPPVQLQLRLTNHGETPVVVEVLDFNSDLGKHVHYFATNLLDSRKATSVQSPAKKKFLEYFSVGTQQKTAS